MMMIENLCIDDQQTCLILSKHHTYIRENLIDDNIIGTHKDLISSLVHHTYTFSFKQKKREIYIYTYKYHFISFSYESFLYQVHVDRLSWFILYITINIRVVRITMCIYICLFSNDICQYWTRLFKNEITSLNANIIVLQC